MNKAERTLVKGSDLGGYSQLAVAATLGVTDLVERLHHTIARRVAPLGQPPVGRTRGITGFVYDSVRGITRGVGALLDLATSAVAGWRNDAASSGQRDTLVAALNGVIGDRLANERNALALPMQLLRDGRPWAQTLDAAPASCGRLLVLVHGLCMHPGQWLREGHDHGAALAEALGLQALHLHYNSGLAIADNGRGLSAQLSALVRDWPVPVTELHLLGHSMGGLVIRSACHAATPESAAWLPVLRSLAFLGTPHRGSPIERAGEWLQQLLSLSPYALPFTALGGLRSAGIQDLRHGGIGAEAHVALPKGVAALAIAGSGGADGTSVRERLLGDGLVPVRSALGRATDDGSPELFRARERRLLPGVGHFGLLDADPVFPLLHDFYRQQRTARG